MLRGGWAARAAVTEAFLMDDHRRGRPVDAMGCNSVVLHPMGGGSGFRRHATRLHRAVDLKSEQFGIATG